MVANKDAGFEGIIIADGIGSHKLAELSSEFCCAELQKLLTEIKTPALIRFDELYNAVKAALITYSSEIEDAQGSSLGTTLLCVLEFDDHYQIAYAGNGSIWHVSGNFNQFSPARYLPWNSINLLNPHSVEENGKAALTNYISVTTAPPTPTVLQLSKNKNLPGEIIILTTDGIYSTDAVAVGKDDKEVIWIKAEENMTRLHDMLDLFLKNDPQHAGNDGLQRSLQDYLNNLSRDGLMHDDTTAGIIISSTTIEYHQQYWEKLKMSVVA